MADDGASSSDSECSGVLNMVDMEDEFDNEYEDMDASHEDDDLAGTEAETEDDGQGAGDAGGNGGNSEGRYWMHDENLCFHLW